MRLYFESETQRSTLPSWSKSDEHRAHGRRVLAALAVGDAGGDRDLLERAVVLIVEEEILGLVVGDVDVRVAVEVEIGGGDAHGAALELREARLRAHVGESAVAIVVEQEIGFRRVIQGAGIVVGGVVSPVCRVEFHVTADEEVHAAVAIVVQPGRTDRPAGDIEARLRRDVLERAVPVIAVEDDAAVAADEQVHPAVVVVIRRDRAHAEQIPADSRPAQSRR